MIDAKRTHKGEDDELRPEYDLKSLKVRKLGPGRKRFGDIVRLEPDVLEVFPDADSVNEALRSSDKDLERKQCRQHKATEIASES